MVALLTRAPRDRVDAPTPTPTVAPMPAPTTPASTIIGPFVDQQGFHVWHISVTQATRRYTVRMAYDPRPDADRGTTDVCIAPAAPLDVGTAVLRAALSAADDCADTAGRRWALLYNTLADHLAFYQDVRDLGVTAWG